MAAGRGEVKARRRKALNSTLTLDKAIAPAATIGESDRPRAGANAPAATGIRITL